MVLTIRRKDLKDRKSIDSLLRAGYALQVRQ